MKQQKSIADSSRFSRGIGCEIHFSKPCFLFSTFPSSSMLNADADAAADVGAQRKKGNGSSFTRTSLVSGMSTSYH
jgi:hypothetical protein